MKKIKFYTDATEKGMPFIQITEGDFKGIRMLIDTGSNSNVFFSPAYNEFKDSFSTLDTRSEIFGLEGTPNEAIDVSAKMSFAGKEYEMTFLVRKNDETMCYALSNEMGFPIAGIIGTFFMAKHGWIIDLGNQEVVIPNIV